MPTPRHHESHSPGLYRSPALTTYVTKQPGVVSWSLPAATAPAGTANWYLKCCRGQPSSRIPPGVSRKAQRAIHQLKLNRLSSTASYQALTRQIESPTCPHCGSGDETAEHLLLLCPKWQQNASVLWWFDWHHRRVPGLWESGGIPHLFGTSVPPYRKRLTGSSWPQQQQQATEKHETKVCNDGPAAASNKLISDTITGGFLSQSLTKQVEKMS